jgi:DNA-binding NtrC family response regulator
MATLLIVDDDPHVLSALQLLFALDGHRCVLAQDPAGALAQYQQTPADLVIQDMNFSVDTTSGAQGLALFHALRARDADLPIVLLTAWTHLEQAVALVKAGASDYLAKPWDDAKLATSVRNLLELAEQRKLAASFAAQAHQVQQERQTQLAGVALRGALIHSSAMQSLVQLSVRVAKSHLPVLITGPNGVGKERLAEIVHYNSAVRAGPMVALNCGALPAELIEAELFGAEAGAYTGASKLREGRFEAADGGSLFLDEIGTLPMSGQIKLLRVIETGCFERLGSSKTRTVHVRVISATNADLPALIKAGQFREDLYYRLNVMPLEVPALSARRTDIVPLAKHFLSAAKLSREAEAALQLHSWPGNVRELRNVMARAELLCANAVITPADLHLPIPATKDADALADLSVEQIETALSTSNHVIADAAALLGMTRQSFYRRMERFGIARQGK